MGDHRADIKLEIEFHGIKDKVDMWINYCPGECDGVDDRIIEFFRRVYEKGMNKYEEIVGNYYELESEKKEKAEYERLKKKYGKPPCEINS